MRRRVAFGSERRRRRRAHAKARACKRSPKNYGGGAKVSDKLEALKNLIPTNNGEVVKADQLFEETADYIVRLRKQVFVLQRLVQLYGSAESQHDNTVVL